MNIWKAGSVFIIRQMAYFFNLTMQRNRQDLASSSRTYIVDVNIGPVGDVDANESSVVEIVYRDEDVVDEMWQLSI